MYSSRLGIELSSPPPGDPFLPGGGSTGHGNPFNPGGGFNDDDEHPPGPPPPPGPPDPGFGGLGLSPLT